MILDEILEIGTVSGTVEATLGMSVRKSGRTTGLTTGQINVLDATVSVSYGSNRTATFDNQLVAGPMSSARRPGRANWNAHGRRSARVPSPPIA